MRYMKGLVMDMNSHTVFGVVKTDPEIRAGKNSDYILAEILDRTSHNGKSNPQNRYSVIMYGERKELEAVKKTILKGKAIYVSGTGFFDKEGEYFIVASELCALEKTDPGVSTETVRSDEDDAVAYLKAEYERLGRD